MPCHFVLHGGPYRELQLRRPAKPQKQFPPPQPGVDQVGMAPIVISSNTSCLDICIYLFLCMSYTEFILELPGAKPFTGALLICGGSTVL